jgi:uncharacterized protein (TIRG00374 family)
MSLVPSIGQRGSARNILIAAIAVLGVGGLLYWAVGRQGFDWAAMGAALRGARISLVLLCLATVYLCYALRAWRWSRFCRYIGPAPFAPLFSATLIGFTALFLLGRAAEPIRPLLIARRQKLSISSQFGIYVLERVFDTGATAILAAISLLGFAHVVLGEGSQDLLIKARAAGVALLTGFSVAVGFLLYFRLHGAAWVKTRLAHWHQRTGWHARVAGMVDGLSEGLQAIRTWGDLAMAVFYSAAHWLLIILIYVLIPWSLGGKLAELGFPAAMLVLVFAMVGSMIQLPAVGGGSQVACIVAYTSLLGIAREPAVAASILLWLVTFAGCSLAGIPLLIRQGFSMGELRRLAAAEKEAEAHGEHIQAGEWGNGRGGNER